MSETTISDIPRAPEVGRITTPVLIENYDDIVEAQKSLIPPENVCKLEVPDALVDMGASTPCLPTSMIQSLGLRALRTLAVRTSASVTERTMYGLTQLTIQGRDRAVQVAELPDGSPVLVGQAPLKILNLVPIPPQQQLVPSPPRG
jgi:predicted aspartyl protease